MAPKNLASLEHNIVFISHLMQTLLLHWIWWLLHWFHLLETMDKYLLFIYTVLISALDCVVEP